MRPYSTTKDRVWSRREIEGLIADGRKIIIFDGQVIKADAWIRYHPGGEKPILHMVGRDGTAEIRAFHSYEAQALMQKYVIGKVPGRWTNFLPPIQGGLFRRHEEEGRIFRTEEVEVNDSSPSSTGHPSPIFDPVEAREDKGDTDASSISSASSISLSDITDSQKPRNAVASDSLTYPSLSVDSQDSILEKYRELGRRIQSAGLYDCPYGAYGVECIRYALLFSAFAVALHFSQYCLSGAFLGLFWHQLAFTVHDAGHLGITHNFHLDTCIGILVADFCGGLSVGWWKRNHNVHHIVTNSPEHDPDIEHMPFFAISPRLFQSLRSTYYDRVMAFDGFAKALIPYQHLLYYPILTMGRFNLYVQSWIYLLSPTQAPRRGPAWWHRYLEIFGHVFFWYWFGYQIMYLRIPNASSRLIFLFTSHMITAPLHVQITLSHFSMSTVDYGVHESFPQKMLRTTMDVDCPQWLDFVHGGLQFQVAHHLFPRLPRHNLRKAQKFVKEFCRETGIPYVIYGFTKGSKEVISRLQEVANQVKVFEECQRFCAKEVVEGRGFEH